MKETIKPFFNYDEWTMTHNIIIDDIMPKLSGSAWKVLTLIIRKTKGWHKECDEVSFSQIKHGTGIKSSTTVSEALKDLEKKGIIKVDRPDLSGDDPARFWKSNIYSLNLDFEVEVERKEKPPTPINEPPPSLKNRLPPCPINEPPLVQKVDTQKKEDSLNKESDKESHTPSSSRKKKSTSKANPPPPAIKVYQDIARRFPDKAAWPAVVETVGDNADDLKLWGEIITTWISRGYKKTNLDGMLDWFKNRAIPVYNGATHVKQFTKDDRPEPPTGKGKVFEGLSAAFRAGSRGPGGAS